MGFGERIRDLRQARGLTQRELAARAGISYAYISKLETGTMSPPRPRIIIKLADILGLGDQETDELFGLAGKIPQDLVPRIDVGIVSALRLISRQSEAGARRRKATGRAAGSPDHESRAASSLGSETFRALIENSLDGIVVLGPKLEVLYQNPATARLLGYLPGELTGEGVLGLIHPDDMRKTAHRLSRVSQVPGSSDRAHLRARHKDGTWHAIDVWARNLMHITAVRGLVIYFRDISGSSGTEGAWAGETAAILTAREYHLTQTELKVLAMLVDGQSNARVAEQLVISSSTVRFHVTNIIRKLGVSNRTEAAALAVRRHVVS